VSFSYTLDDLSFLSREHVEFVHQLVDLHIRRCNLPLDHGLLLVGPGLGKPLVEIEHPLNNGNHFIVAGDVDGIQRIDDVDWMNK